MSGEANRRPLVVDPASLDLPEPMEFGGVVFQVRHCSPRKTREIRLGLGLPAVAPSDERLSNERREAFDDAVLDWVLESWPEGEVVDGKGRPVPCDLSGKRLLVENFETFAKLLTQFSEILWAKKQTAARDELGNSRSSSPPDAKPTGTASTADSTAAGSKADANSDDSEAA